MSDELTEARARIEAAQEAIAALRVWSYQSRTITSAEMWLTVSPVLDILRGDDT